MRAAALQGGFADPAPESARAFRLILDAMARPGRVHRVAGAAPPAPLSPAAGAVLLVLADADTPLHLAPALDRPDLRDWIAFHCAAPSAPAERAAFALGTWEALQPLDRFAIGTPDYPDRSATLIVEVPALAPATHRLIGPGIRDVAEMRLPGMPRAAAFPLGLDLILTCGDSLACLPRSTSVEAF